MNVPRMNRSERRRLVKTGKSSGDVDTALRFLAVANLGEGKTSPTVAAELGLAVSTVVRAGNRFCERGEAGLLDGRKNNGQAKVDSKFRRCLERVLLRTPEQFGWKRPTWTRELLCLQMELEGFALVSVATMGRTLAAIGARLGTPKPIVACPWKRDAREARLHEIRELEAVATQEEPVLYSDEVDIHLNPKIGRDWMLKGHQRRVLTPGQNEKFYLAGALDARTGELHVTGGYSKNAVLFCDMLELLVARYPKARRIHLIVDNYCIHSAKLVQARLAALKGRIVLHFLPPYCPDANRIERVWQDLHANVTRNHRCRTMARLLMKAKDYLDNYVSRRCLERHMRCEKLAA